MPEEDAACLRQYAGRYCGLRGGCTSVSCWNSSQAYRTASWFWMTVRCIANTVSDPRREIHESHTQFSLLQPSLRTLSVTHKNPYRRNEMITNLS